MKIGFVSAWLERGATYVTKSYIGLLKDKHEILVYARGGEKYEKGNPNLDTKNITWGLRLGSTKIDWSHFAKWIRRNNLDVIFFNEQRDILIVLMIKKFFPNIKVGAYVDYYTEDSVSDFKIYDFLICNTRRHYSVFSWHKGAYYIPWGTDIDIFNINEQQMQQNNTKLKFFHSMGMSERKGTDILVNSFINGKLYEKNAKLIIHSQVNIDHIISEYDSKKYNIEIIKKEVPAPGLYHLGDVYVYPTTLDGLGLTIYEALACGMPVITTDNPPMNEIVNESNGRLVKVELLRSRKDGYYWPLSFVNEESLIQAMEYYCKNRSNLAVFKEVARKFAETNLNIYDRKDSVCKIFEQAPLLKRTTNEIEEWIAKEKFKQKKIKNRGVIDMFLSNSVKHILRSKVEGKRNQ
ncbi:glycosyltransferase [Cytobacillus oceanisediminis]|uniref:glycosyltransferase n=1 Tax=Cytobacillus oceanisediminis TaxID=665099 RepID=UPI0037365269